MRMLDMFELRHRAFDGVPYWAISHGAPDTLTDAVRDAHGQWLPNDAVYLLCWQVWSWLADFAENGGDLGRDDLAHECADGVLDRDYVYRAERLEWFRNDPGAMDYCDTFAEDYAGQYAPISETIGNGLWLRLRHVTECLCDVARDVHGVTA
jgi:hypothetical protein